MKRFLTLIFAFFMTIIAVNADPIVELAAPRVLNQKSAPDLNLDVAPGTHVKTSKSKLIAKKHIKYKKHKKIVVKPDYRKLSKLVEYGYYNYSDGQLENLIKKNPKDIKAQALLTISMAKQFKLEAAQKNVDKFLKLYPKNSDFHYAQGIIYFQQTHSSNMKYRSISAKLISDAKTEFLKAIEDDKTNAKAYNAAGVIALSQGNVDEAKKYFTQAVKFDNVYSMAIDNLGTIDLLQNKLADAEKKFNQALSYNTKNSTAMYHLAQVYMQKKDYGKALYHLNNALALAPSSSAINNLMGKAYFKQGNDAAAIVSLKKSIELNPETAVSYLDLSNIYEKRGDKTNAIEQLKTAININPNLNEAKLKIADLSYSNSDYDQAIVFYSKLLDTDYNDKALKGLANAYYAKAQNCIGKSYLTTNHDLQSAVSLINKAIEANGKDLELYLAKLKLSDLTGQKEESKVTLKKIILTPANDVQSLVAKGEAYLTLYDYANAQKTFNDAINMSKTADDDFYLSEIFLYQKQFESAEKINKKILSYDKQNQDAICNLEYINKSLKLADDYFKSANGIMITRNYTLAAEYYSRSLSVNPNNAEANLRLAKIYDKQNEYQNAISHYKAYIGLAPLGRDVIRVKKRILVIENKL